MYVIAGVTGQTGKVAAEALLAQGKRVRVLVRDAKKAEAWRARGAEIAVADLEDVPALAAALEGASGAYFLLPPNYASTDYARDNAARTRAIGAAVAKAGVPHVVFLSSIGAQHDSGTGPIATLHHAEVELPKLAPATHFTFLRAGYFFENFAGDLAVFRARGALPAIFDPKRRIPMIATADIGRAAAEALIAGPPAEATKVVELAGPRDLSVSAVAEEIAALTGEGVPVAQVPPEMVRGVLEQAGLSSHFAGLYAEMASALDSGRVDYEPGRPVLRGSVGPREAMKALLSAA